MSARALRRPGAAALAAVALALGACGDDEDRVEKQPATDTAAGDAATATAPRERTETEARTETESTETGQRFDDSGGTGGASPEDQPGGAGDEEPARSQALFTGRGGRISPRVVRVPPFIAIRVELRSADGATYRLRGGGRTVSADSEVSSASTSFAGLRPGRRLVLSGPHGSVAVEASAEPGP